MAQKVSSFAVSRIILAANNYRVFDYPDGNREDSRAAELLLNKLVAAGLLIKKDSLHRNAQVVQNIWSAASLFTRVISWTTIAPLTLKFHL